MFDFRSRLSRAFLSLFKALIPFIIFFLALAVSESVHLVGLTECERLKGKQTDNEMYSYIDSTSLQTLSGRPFSQIRIPAESVHSESI